MRNHFLHQTQRAEAFMSLEGPVSGPVDGRLALEPFGLWHWLLDPQPLIIRHLCMNSTEKSNSSTETRIIDESQAQLAPQELASDKSHFSCLSPLVKQLILLESSTSKTLNLSSPDYFLPTKRLDWTKLHQDALTVLPKAEGFSVQEADQSDLIWFHAAKNTQSIALEAHSTLKETSMESIRELFPKSMASSFAPHLLKVHEEFLRSGHVVLAFSALCTFLERSLGDLFCALEEKRQTNAKIRRKPPPLVRDLLQTKEIAELLGESLFLLQVMIGSPRALNLRNIIWHGFVAPHELHPGYYWLLLWLMLEIFERDFPEVEAIPPREMKDLGRVPPETYDFGLGASSALAEVGQDDSTTSRIRSDIALLLHRSPFVLPFRADTFLLSYDYYSRGESDPFGYYFSLVLALPALEHCLRAAWVSANGLPQQLLCADSFRYYTVLDMFLDTHLHPFMTVEALTTGSLGATSDPSAAPKVASDALPMPPSLLVDELGVRAFVALNDTFVYPYGPRPRDRISHGDVKPECVTRLAAARCLELVLYLALQADQKRASLLHPDKLTRLDLSKELETCREFYSHYVSCWHPHSLLERQLHDTTLSSWRQWLSSVLLIPSSVADDVESTEDMLLRRLGYKDETEACLQMLQTLRERRSSKAPSTLISPLIDFISTSAFDLGAKSIPEAATSHLQLTFFDTLHSAPTTTSSCDSARKLCVEVDTLITLWLAKLAAQKEQVETGQATKRLEASFHKQLFVLDYTTAFFATLLLFCESQLHFSNLDAKSTRKLMTPITQLKQKIENNAWDESTVLFGTTLDILRVLMS